MMFAVLLLQVAHQLAERLAFFRHDGRQQQRIQNAVALGQVATNADSAGFLAADEDVALEHEVADVLEADTALVHFAAVFRADAIDHASGVEGANDFARPLLALQQPLEDDRENLVRVHEAAVFGDGTEAVGIAICGKPRGALLAHYRLLKQFDVRQDGLGINAREQRVQLATNFYVVDVGLGKDALEHAAAGAVHDVDRELETGLLDGVEVDKLLYCRDVRSLEVGAKNLATGTIYLRCVERTLDRLDDSGCGRTAVSRLVFHTVPVPGIMAGGDHHATSCLQVHHGVRKRRRGSVVVREMHGDAGSSKHFGNGFGEVARAKARIVANYEAIGRIFVGVNVVSNRITDAAHIVERVVIGYYAAPSVRTELDLSRHTERSV